MSIYKNSSKIITGHLAELLAEVKRLNAKTIVVLSSPTVSNIPKVKSFIEEASLLCDIIVSNSIKPDAPIGDLDRLISKTDKPDLIIGIGGGSVVDSAKALSVGWQGATIKDLFYKKQNMPTTKIPVIAVPTTAGTGAELSYGAILYDTENKVKSGIRGELIQPDIAFLDIELYTYASNKLIAEVGFDCLTHAVETYISTASGPVVRYQSVAAIQTVFDYLPLAAKFKDIHALEKMAIAATMMGVNLALSTTCLPHRIQYAIGPVTNTSHAQGLIMLYRGWLHEISKTDKFAMLLQDLHLSEEEMLAKVAQLKTELNIDYALGQHGVVEEQLEEITKNVTGNLSNDPCYQSNETIITILKNSL